MTIAVGKLMVVIEDLCGCLNRGDPVQQFLFRRLGCTHPMSSCENPLIGRSSSCWPVYRRPSCLPGLCHPGLVVATACSKKSARGWHKQIACLHPPAALKLARIPDTVIA